MVRLNPLVLLSFGVFSLLGSFAIRSLLVGLVAVSAYAVAALLFLPGWRYPLVCLGFGLFAAVSIVWSTWRLGGHDEMEAAVAGLRILVLAWPGSVLTGFIDPAALADHLAQSLRLPARFVASFSASLQRFATLGHTWQELERARRARGFGPSRNPLVRTRNLAGMAFALLVHAMRGASTTAIAMDARGFATAQGRTWAEPASWTRLDLFGLAAAALLGAVPLLVQLWV
ncbi:MAG: energy-coupling factor transport system permease protein [Nocardioidaceae bacterium]|nr:energy-coupling factor transport system permease protein [Nocardioidaceae bacterium]